MRSFNAVAIVIALTMSACSFKKDDAKNDSTPKESSPSDVVETIQKEQEKQAFEGKLTEQNVVVTFTEQPTPRVYQMKVTWPEQIKRIQVSVNDETPVIYTSANPGNVYEKLVFSERPQNIELIAYDSLGGAPISSLSITRSAPPDYVLESFITLRKDTVIEVNRFFILPNSQILTNGNHLSIITKKLIIQTNEALDAFASEGSLANAHIITHVPGDKINSELDSRESAITIQAEEAIGLLRVGLVGADGNNGRDGDIIEKALGISKSNTINDGTPGENGVLKSMTLFKGMNPDGTPREKEVFLCEKAPTNGTNGKPGSAGHAGENGQDAGPTGSLSIILKDQAQFSLQVIQKAGRPGKGGKGATGHNGGSGGQPGKNPGHPCSSAQKGSDGPQGPNGADGRDGQPGKIGNILPGVKQIKVIQL